MVLRTFGGSFGVTAVGLLLAFLYGGNTGLVVAAILIVLEISVSFDNAVVNATVLGELSAFWQKLFLTLGVLIAVFGMRLAFPLIIVGITAHLSPAEAVHLALEKGSVHEPGSYANLLHEAHPAIAAFGGMFLLMLFLGFIFEEREITWLSWLERPLARIGKLDQLSVVVASVLLLIAATQLAPEGKVVSVLMSGVLGMVTYILVNGLSGLLEEHEAAREEAEAEHDQAALTPQPAQVSRGRATGELALKTGKAAFFSFLYLEVLDASFSFDGVIGAFAITSDPIIIAIGLGVGAMYIRSLTVFLVRKGTLSDYVYLEHGALWAIGSLAVLLLLTIRYEIPEVVTGLIGVGFIAAALVSSIRRNRRLDGTPAGASSDRDPAPAAV
ncbi:DUF475 domain-containing protein [Jatrophihabitans sp.]|uniref:DUF475 domain-containing protein n=1 Tax=Jatrophihabitans sp. TaxID=1932789 RepID=UPI002CE12DE1|nr:DUF475 domain-containing protein [Jatrophihabitans sp.]